MDFDMDIDDVTDADVAAAADNPMMQSSTGSVKTSPYFASGSMATLCPPNPQVAALAGKLASQTGHPNKFGTGD